MEGIYMTPVSRLIEILLAVSGLAIVYFMSRLFISKHAWGDGAQYEMLDMPTPERDDFEELDGPTAPAVAGDRTMGVRVRDEAVDYAAALGLIGLEDRIVRFGFTLALSYLSITWFGLRSLAMWLLLVPVLYMLVTAFVGKDPIYKALGLSTQFD